MPTTHRRPRPVTDDHRRRSLRTRPLRWVLAFGLAGLACLQLSARAPNAPASPNIPTSVARPVIGLPVSSPTLIGSSPAESPGETWGYSTQGQFRIVRYSTASGWRIEPTPKDIHGAPLSGFGPAPGPQAGRATPHGGVAIVGEDEAHTGQVLVRDPGGAFKEAPSLTVEPTGGAGPDEPTALLQPEETLIAQGGNAHVLMTATDGDGGHTAVFLVPFEGSATRVQDGVLAYDGMSWKREPICAGVEAAGCSHPASGFKVVGIDASSPRDAWLLATGGAPGAGVELFAREVTSAGARWTQRALGGQLGALFAQASPSLPEGVAAQVAPLTRGQPLTVTNEGMWVDGQLKISGQSEPIPFTLFYEPGSGNEGQVAASWCQAPSAAKALCTHPLESEWPSGEYRSFAWSEGAPFGQRVVTGLDNGVSLSLHGVEFMRVAGVGGEAGANAGAAFSSPGEGWLGDYGEPITHLSTAQAPSQLQPWSVPFRRPLTAIATQPGRTAGDIDAQAIAVGEKGQVAHYTPGQGWAPEALLNSIGQAQEAELRGVAWPEAERAYAVGTHGAMWLWQASTGLWEPDPARPPNLFLANFTGIAFDPSNPARGYAIGQQKTLLSYGKSWTQEPTCEAGVPQPCLPPELEKADFTSIAFAGEEALVTYYIPRIPGQPYPTGPRGGVLVNDGSGWRIDTGAEETLNALRTPERVAGLPDGGAAIAGHGAVIERQGPGAPWQPAPAGTFEEWPVAALAAFREGGQLRTAVSIAAEPGAVPYSIVDMPLEQTPPEGQAPVVTDPFPLPNSGFLLRETAGGWHDEEHQDYPRTSRPGVGLIDWPNQPDAVLALALSPEGGQGWAVGGQTGQINNQGLGEKYVEAIQTAGVMRYPASGSAPSGFSSAPEQTEPGSVSFAIGGGAQCASACADFANDDLGPDALLKNAIARAGETTGAGGAGGVRNFLYTGSRLPSGLSTAGGFGAPAFRREERRYAELLSAPSEAMKVFAAPTASDLDEAGGLSTFTEALGEHAGPAGAVRLAETGAYAFAEGGVWVIVLDYSHPTLGSRQQCWLAEQLAQARHVGPAIVIGNRGMVGAANAAADASQVGSILATGAPPAGCAPGLKPAAASAYFYDEPEADRELTIAAGGHSLPAYGSGTLGYIRSPEKLQTEFLGASGFLLAEIATGQRNAATNVAPVNVQLVPDIAELALKATNGVLLRRSQPALFEALARRPHAGMRCQVLSAACTFDPDPYVPIPDPCQGSGCASGIFPAYTFTSSNPDIGQFVEADPASLGGTTVLQSANGKPIPDEPRAPGGGLTPDGRFTQNGSGQQLNEKGEVIPRTASGLFCAYNAGSTTVTVHTGGLSYAERLTILDGSVKQPCGTVPLRNPPTPSQQAQLPVPVPTPAPTPATTPAGTLPPPPAPTAAPTTPPVHVHPLTPVPVPPPPAQLFPIVPLLPPAAPEVARPTPPSGTAEVQAQSPVSQQVTAAEREHEEEAAIQHVHHMAAYERPDQTPLPGWPLGLVPVAALAALALRRSLSAPVPVRAHARDER